jgi:hypothetical protein
VLIPAALRLFGFSSGHARFFSHALHTAAQLERTPRRACWSDLQSQSGTVFRCLPKPAHIEPWGAGVEQDVSHFSKKLLPLRQVLYPLARCTRKRNIIKTKSVFLWQKAISGATLTPVSEE